MTTRKPRSNIFTKVLLISLFLALAAIMLGACSQTPDAPASPIEPTSVTSDISQESGVGTENPTPEITLAEMNQFWADDDPFLGPEDAPVVIVEFSDYLCPYCGYFYLQTLPRILEAYPDEVRFVHRDFPILAEESANASLAAACALEQDLYWELHALFFSAHADFDPEVPHDSDGAFFESLVAKFSDEEIEGYVTAAGMDLDTYQSCIEEGVGREEIIFDIQVGSQLEIDSVPFYIVNGQLIPGLMPFETWEQIIDAGLTATGF